MNQLAESVHQSVKLLRYKQLSAYGSRVSESMQQTVLMALTNELTTVDYNDRLSGLRFCWRT
jgi:hypothetical protein